MRPRMSRFIKLVMMLSALAILCTGCTKMAGRNQQGVRWSGEVVPFQPNILHAPDNLYALRPIDDDPVTVRNFGPAMQHPGLRRLLGVSQDQFDRADVIAFEGNGGGAAGPAQGWESSIWTFTDGTNSYIARFNENAGPASDPAVIATGSVIGSDGTASSGNNAYRKFFKMCCPDPSNPVVSYILFDLDAVNPVIDTDSPSFAVKLEVGFPVFGPEGSPDPDAIGIFTRCSGTCPAR